MSCKNEKLYQEHIDEMFAVNPIFSDEDVDRILDRLLLFMPNDGKLYKYRSIEGKAFDNAYSTLEKRYLWVPKANELNDDEDTILYYDPEKCIEEIKNYICAHPYEFMTTLINATERKFPIGKTKKDEEIIRKTCKCFDKKTGKLNRGRLLMLLVKDGIPKNKATKQIDDVELFIINYINNHMQMVESIAEMHMMYNDKIRGLAYVYSMSEDYDCNQMWAYYANSNNGFCIEYDFNKVKNLSYDLKRKLINLYKVKYCEKAEEFEFGSLLDWYFNGKDDRLFSNEQKRILNLLLTKKIGWQHEKEWRLFMTDVVEHKIEADIVSGIIIDERAKDCKNGKDLLNLAKERGWCVMIRKTTVTKTKHIYEEWRE